MKTINIHIYGIVQGVGFRPFVSRAAKAAGVSGTVANRGSFVDVYAKGDDEQLDKFLGIIKHEPPERSVILEIDVTDCEEDFDFKTFEIIESEKEIGDIFVSPDIATCDKCRAELFDKTNKRYLHPFINCTQCGPRLTIMDTMPYDRERTTMGEFLMCPDCAAEYVDPKTRRYDAQPVCCNDCGPEVYIIGTNIKGGAAITETRRAVMSGKIVAIKGIGGFHLCCDAKNEKAVMRLRKLKNRPMKPFALMMKNIGTAERECVITPVQKEYLTGWQKPIVLLEKREETSISEYIAPDNITVGVMLPYAPVQMLLFDYPDDVKMSDCLVMTSGNVRGAPICRSDEDALKEIAGFCDIILSHNRKILLRADDSVMDQLFDKPYMIRRSRGFAPLPFMIKHGKNSRILAIGGELKNSFCIAKNGLLYPSPYIGDMADIRTVQALKESVGRMCGLLECEPQAVVCDMHPLYNTVAFAEEFAKEKNIPLIKIQHHYAHILSCMAENGCEQPVIGLSFDGTGYGTDGTIWGGELLICDYEKFERIGSIAPFMQSGGDISAKEGWRIAASILRSSTENAAEICEKLEICTEKEYNLQKTMAEKKINSVLSTSCGRLFDAVSAILGIRRASTFEGEASTALMYHAQLYEKENGGFVPNYSIYKSFFCEKAFSYKNGFIELNTSNYAANIAERRLNGEDINALAYEFHAVLADMAAQACKKAREKTDINICALSGGVFQNSLLVRLCKKRLEDYGFKVLLHSLVPPNDGGIALGQATAGAALKF